MRFNIMPRDPFIFVCWVAFAVGLCSLALTLGIILYNGPTEPPQIPWRYGDKVVITHGFYSGQKAKIMGRDWIGKKWRYELWGDGEASIDAHTRFDETEFVLREER